MVLRLCVFWCVVWSERIYLFQNWRIFRPVSSSNLCCAYPRLGVFFLTEKSGMFVWLSRAHGDRRAFNIVINNWCLVLFRLCGFKFGDSMLHFINRYRNTLNQYLWASIALDYMTNSSVLYNKSCLLVHL